MWVFKEQPQMTFKIKTLHASVIKWGKLQKMTRMYTDEFYRMLATDWLLSNPMKFTVDLQMGVGHTAYFKWIFIHIY
jgi:hypothetical protein